MAKTQKQAVSAPKDYDTKLEDFAAVIQENVQELFFDAHDHEVMSAAPTAGEGAPGDLKFVDDGTDVKMYVRTNRGWFYSATLTAL